MERSRLLNILLVLLIIIAALVLAQLLWQFISGFGDVLLLFILGWILSFILEPIVDSVCRDPIPNSLVRLADRAFGARQARALDDLCVSRTAAVLIVYLGLLALVIIVIALFLPSTVAQLTQIGSQLPDYVARAPGIGLAVQDQLSRFGIRVDLQDAVRNAVGMLQGAASTLIQNALGIFTSLLTLLANVFIVLILSFYMSLDGSRVRRQLMTMVPESFRREANYLSESVNRTFGGFIRGQLVQALLVGVGTAVAMEMLGLNFVLAASLFSGLFMLIPLVGPFLSLLGPLLVVLFQAPGLFVWLFAALFLYQFVITNVLMPRILSSALGLHPLLVFAGILLGIKVGGFWGAFFGIPVAGVIWAMVEYFIDKWRRGEEEQQANVPKSS